MSRARSSCEPARRIDAITDADVAMMSAATFLESAIVVDGLGDPVKSRRLDDLVTALGIEVVDVTPEQARIARAACRDFGKGSGHPAGLDFGDLFAYALAVDKRQALLFKAADFTHTDVAPTLA